MPDLTTAIKGGFKRALARWGFYVERRSKDNSLDTHLFYVLTVLGINCVLDVGAHCGDYGHELRRLGYAGRIVSFEPIAASFAELQRVSAADAAWQSHQLALGAEERTAEINVLSGRTFSSFLPPNDYGREQFGSRMQIERTEVVEVKRLDQVLAQCVAGIAHPRLFLKIDTQGYDRAVLEGAGHELERILALQTELSVKPIYKGMSTSFVESIAFLQEHGFAISGLFPVTWDENDQLGVIEFDCVMYRPRHERSGRG